MRASNEVMNLRLEELKAAQVDFDIAADMIAELEAEVAESRSALFRAQGTLVQTIEVAKYTAAVACILARSVVDAE
eukprot:3302370-Pleurochrysis_carterae.AAC.1